MKKCKDCGSTHIVKNGTNEHINKNGHKVVWQAYYCKSCHSTPCERIRG